MIAGRIYAITNICNGTKYIGQTTLSLEERFKLHCADAKKERNKYRKLYIAMNEYGFDSFEIEELETIEDNKILNEREIFWIEKLHTFKKGYNETKGGQGSLVYDHDEIITLYTENKTIPEISKLTGSEESNIRKILRRNHVKLRGKFKPIEQFDLENNYIQTFDNPSMAREWLLSANITKDQKANSRICECCNHKRKSIYGYRWEYSDNEK